MKERGAYMSAEGKKVAKIAHHAVMLRIAKEDAMSENNAHASEQAFFYGAEGGKNAILAFSFPPKMSFWPFHFHQKMPFWPFF
jgi:hypothetical protein